MRVFVIITVIFIISLSIYFINQPLTNLIIKEKPIEIVCISPVQALISYKPNSSVIIQTIKKSDESASTSLNQKAMKIYMNFSKEIKREIFYLQLPSLEKIKEIESMIYEWKKNPFKLPKLIKTLLTLNSNFSTGDKITLISAAIKLTPSKIIFINSENEIEKKDNTDNSNISVEIINASGDRKIIKQVTDKLKNKKIDIIDQKNSTSYRETKIIINSINNYEKAKEIMDILGIKNTEIYIEKGFIIGDVKVIISKDYKGD